MLLALILADQSPSRFSQYSFFVSRPCSSDQVWADLLKSGSCGSPYASINFYVQLSDRSEGMSSAENRMPMTLAEYLEWGPLQTLKHEFWAV
jgi:hypothetical protein